MYAVRLNGLTIHVKKQNIYIYDFFDDACDAEIAVILDYLVEEGFIDPEKEVNVIVKHQSILQCIKKASKRKN